MDRRIVLVLVFLGLLAVLLPALVIGCSQDVDAVEIVNIFAGADCSSPVLVSVVPESGSVVRLVFDEPVRLYDRASMPFQARADGKNVYVTLDSTLEPGVQTTIEGRVKDLSGNTAGFSVRVWGHNPAVPGILINEFTTKGSARSPDRTELLVLGEGNLNGVVLYAGTPQDHDARLMFSDVDVHEGDLLTVWWTETFPEGAQTGKNDFCAGCADGLSANNGTLVLCRSPALGAQVLDAVVYSNFTASQDGFGTKSARERAQWVLEDGAWKGEAVDSSTSTATRSISRNLAGSDTDACADWFVTVTGGSSFGSPNTSEAY